MKPSPLALSFSSVSANDFDSLVALRIAAMRESLERVGRFDPERARERLRSTFHPEHTQFIVLAGQRIGFYTFRPLADGFHLDHLYIHPQSQSRGVGSFVMQHLIAQAEEKQMPIHVGVLRESASNRFYQRHGFVPVREDAWDIYYVREASVSRLFQEFLETNDGGALAEYVIAHPNQMASCGHDYPALHRLLDFTVKDEAFRVTRCGSCNERLFIKRLVIAPGAEVGVPYGLSGDALTRWIAEETEHPQKGPQDWNKYLGASQQFVDGVILNGGFVNNNILRVQLVTGEEITAVLSNPRQYGCLFGDLAGYRVSVRLCVPPKMHRIITLKRPAAKSV